jgi:hypothetical protein
LSACLRSCLIHVVSVCQQRCLLRCPIKFLSGCSGQVCYSVLRVRVYGLRLQACHQAWHLRLPVCTAGVPIIANRRFLETYTMFPEDCVLVPRNAKETDIDVMRQLLYSSNDQLKAPRAALGRLQTELNTQALQKLLGFLEPFYPSLYSRYGPGKRKKGGPRPIIVPL